MDLDTHLKRKSNRPSETTLNNLRKEYRLHYFHPVELHNKTEDDLLYFETSKFLFYGYKIETMKTSYDSDGQSNEEMVSYVGIMMFFGGETYIGEINNNFRPHGEGMMFFSVGAVLRGFFEEGKAHGNALISLPFEVNILARLDRGIVHKQLIKIDYKSNLVNYLKYIQGNFVEYEKESFIDEELINHVRDSMGSNLVPDHMKSFSDDSLYFGTFICGSDSLYFGFIKNGKAIGWGVTVDISVLIMNESKYIQESISWRLTNNLDEHESIAVGINQDGNMIFGIESKGVLFGELGVFYPKENRFQKAIIKEGDLDFEPEYFEGIQKNFVTNIYLEYLKNKKFPKRELNIVPIVFDLTYFNDLFFFYLYGHLKEKTREIFKDNLQLSQEGFFKIPVGPDSNTNEISDSIGNNLDLKNRMGSEDMTLFELQSGQKNRILHGVQSEINRGTSPKSDSLKYTLEHDNSLSYNNKLSKTLGMNETEARKRSSFVKEDRRVAKTSHNVGHENLIVIEELNEEFRKSSKSREIKSIINNMSKEKPANLEDVNSFSDRNRNVEIKSEKLTRSIQSQLEKSRHDYNNYSKKDKSLKNQASDPKLTEDSKFTNEIEIENTKEIMKFDDTLFEPQNTNTGKETVTQKYKDKATITEELKAKFVFLLPPSSMRQLSEKNPKFFGS